MTSNVDSKDPYVITGEKRELGVLVARGTTVFMVSLIKQVLSICDENGFEEVTNPYLQE